VAKEFFVHIGHVVLKNRSTFSPFNTLRKQLPLRLSQFHELSLITFFWHAGCNFVYLARPKRRVMKSRKHEKLIFAKRGGGWMRAAFVLAKALHYGRAAQRDECNGFPYTAAMEWRMAAELLTSGSFPAEYCWRQWERIMHLPREIAGSLVGPRNVVLLDSTSAQPAMNQAPLATAA
jgi:hypothetical protein